MSNLGNGEKAEMLKTRADVNLTLLPDFLFRGFQWDFNALCFWRAVALRRLKPRGPDQGTRAHAPEAEHFLQNDLSQMPTVPPRKASLKHRFSAQLLNVVVHLILQLGPSPVFALAMVPSLMV